MIKTAVIMTIVIVQVLEQAQFQILPLKNEKEEDADITDVQVTRLMYIESVIFNQRKKVLLH